jgi:hypothetical protein
VLVRRVNGKKEKEDKGRKNRMRRRDNKKEGIVIKNGEEKEKNKEGYDNKEEDKAST